MGFRDNNESIIQVKGRKEGLVFHFNTKLATFKELCNLLEEKLLSGGEFFMGATYILQPSEPFNEGEESVISAIFAAYKMKKGEFESFSLENEGDSKQNTGSLPAKAGFEDGVLYMQPNNSDTVLIKRSLRSGNNIVVKGNAVVYGDVNVGAELKASGSIVVMGTCRGLVHAGAEGDKDAFVIVYRLNSKQIRIADTSAIVSDISEEANLIPQKIVLENDEIFLKNYQSNPIKKIG